jgi:aminoglycoside phosphotransferase (APT) family kinase protein
VLRAARYPEVKHLDQEANALGLLDLPQVPKLLFFDAKSEIKNRAWILESYVEGHGAKELSVEQYRSLGTLLAQIHSVKSPHKKTLDFWKYYLSASKRFGDEDYLLNHPHPRLQALIRSAKPYMDSQTQRYENIDETLVHADATPSNVLVNGQEVSLIDWEFSQFKDPMSDFSTVYYDDLEYNHGKWRPRISTEKKSALFDGYTSQGGTLDENRIDVWMNLDKLGAASFLYWRVHEAGRTDIVEQTAQYLLDFENLLGSLEKHLL